MTARGAPRPHRCTSCRYVGPRAFDQCPECEEWGTALVSLPAAVDTLATDGRSGRQLLSEVEPHVVSYAPCPEPWRTALGGGIPLACTALMHGRGGVGKTTELLRLVGSTPRSMFAPCEPGMGASRLRDYGERGGIDISATWVPKVTTLDALAAELSRPPAPCVVVVDSLTALGGEGNELPTLRTLRRALPSSSSLFGIVHVTKAGVMAGSEDLRHECDLVIRLEREWIVIEKTRDPMPERTARPARL